MQIEKYIADNIIMLCQKRGVSKYRLSQLSGISQSSLGRIIARESIPSLITLEKICTALGVTLSQFFREDKYQDMTGSQREILDIWDDLNSEEQNVVLAMLRGLQKRKQVREV